MEICRVSEKLTRAEQTAAWQAIVRERLGEGVEISYVVDGRPVIENGFISVSHTRGWVAVVYNPAGPCAIDIELKSRVLSDRVRQRYGLGSMRDWCARETVYKYGRPAEVRFIDHPELVVATIGLAEAVSPSLGVATCFSARCDAKKT